MVEGSASTLINRPSSEVFDAVADVTRMGHWSPECTGGRWGMQQTLARMKNALEV